MLCLMGADGAEGYEEVLRSDRELQAVPGGEVPLWAIHGHPALIVWAASPSLRSGPAHTHR